jgi:hypothetical protein
MTDSPVTPRTGKPRTPEGRALLRDLWGAYAPRVESGDEGVGTRIARIEEQAMTEGWDRGRAALASTPSTPDTDLRQASAILTAYALQCEQDFPDEPKIAEGVRMARAALWDSQNGLAGTPDTGLTAERRERLFTEIDERFGRNVARFVDARLTEADR